MRIYLSGPMTSMPDLNRPAFDAAAKRLREQGYFVINPAELSALFGTQEEIAESFEFYYHLLSNLGEDFFDRGLPSQPVMKRTALARSTLAADLAAVRSCDAIYLLRGWEKSRGAKKELTEALAHGLTVMQEGGGK